MLKVKNPDERMSKWMEIYIMLVDLKMSVLPSTSIGSTQAYSDI